MRGTLWLEIWSKHKQQAVEERKRGGLLDFKFDFEYFVSKLLCLNNKNLRGSRIRSKTQKWGVLNKKCVFDVSFWSFYLVLFFFISCLTWWSWRFWSWSQHLSWSLSLDQDCFNGGNKGPVRGDFWNSRDVEGGIRHPGVNPPSKVMWGTPGVLYGGSNDQFVNSEKALGNQMVAHGSRGEKWRFDGVKVGPCSEFDTRARACVRRAVRC